MVVCPYCGKENNQPDAAYCLYCGSSLRQQQSQGISNSAPAPSATARGYGTPASTSVSSFDLSERYEKALARVEQLGNIVIILAILTLALVLIG